MNIKHLPNGTSPYESCGYERVPEIVLADQHVIVYCRIEGNKESILPTLSYTLNGEKRASINGNLIRCDEQGRFYYSFKLGTFNTANKESLQEKAAIQILTIFLEPLFLSLYLLFNRNSANNKSY